MKITYTPADGLVCDSSVVTLRGVRPVLNGTLEAAQVGKNTSEHIELIYPISGGGRFGIEVHQEGGRCWLHWWVEGLDSSTPLDSFGVRFERLENLRAYLRTGYFSWDGSGYIEPEALRQAGIKEAKNGYAMTQFLPRCGTGSLVLGFDRHDRFQQTFTVDVQQTPASLTILTLWDQKAHAGRCESERLYLIEDESSEAEKPLRAWAQLVADSSPIPPRRTTPPIIGWCSWYNLYAAINEANILEQLRGVAEVAKRENLPMWVFQIDDGFTPEMGDWLDVKPQFPRGIKPLLDDIRAAGFVPGLWIAPFMVGNRSKLYQEHPDWVVVDRQTGGPLAHMRFYGEFRWHKRSEEYYILDITHPDAFAYLQQVFHTWRWEWGCDYFKTDFMHFGSEYGPDRAQWHTPGLTRIEIWRRAAELIREEIGDATWLGCGCPLWASVGLVDGVRIGRDVGVEWKGNASTQSPLLDLAARNFAQPILWQADPDCILLRERFHHLSETELHSAAIYAAMSGGVLTTSDALHNLSSERLRLWKFLLNSAPALCRYPLLGSGDIVSVQVRTSDPGSALFVLNTGENPVERTYTLASLGFPAPQYLYNWTEGLLSSNPVDRFSVVLAAHQGKLLFAAQTPLEALPEHLP